MDDDNYRPPDILYDITDLVSHAPSSFDRSGFWYFKNRVVIETDDLDVEVHLNEVNDAEQDRIRRSIVNCISNFQETFGLPKIQNKQTLEAYLFNNLDDYNKIGSSTNFTDSFGFRITPKTLGLAFQNPYMIFATKRDISTLNHEIAHSLNYHAVGFRAQCLWVVFMEGLADYFEFLYTSESFKNSGTHIKHTFAVTLDAESRKDTLDEIRETFNSDRRAFQKQRVNLYAVGYSLVSYLQEKNATLIKDLFHKISRFDTMQNACDYSRRFVHELHEEHDESFKTWLHHKYSILAGTTTQNTELHEAARDGRLDRVLELVNKGAEVNAADEGGWTPLHYAAWKDQLQVANFLVDRGANINAVENSNAGRKPIHIAAESGHRNIVKFLLNRGVNSNSVATRNEWTPLHYAVRNGHVGTAKFLIDREANINAKEDYGWTVLHFAGYYDNASLELAALLIVNGANIHAKTDTAWENQNKYYKKGSTPLDVATVYGKQQLVDLLEEKISQRNSYWSPLHYAAKHGNIELASFMIEHGANMEAQESDGGAPIHVAAQSGHKNLVEFFLSRGMSVDYRERSGWTPLLYAAWTGQLDVAKFLVDAGADVNAVESVNGGKKAIHVAAEGGHENIIEFLLSKGISVNDISDNNAWTPLHYAVRNGRIEMTMMLLDRGANIDAKENYGWTVLHFVGYYNTAQLELAALLIEKGANINAKTYEVWEYKGRYYKKGGTPLDVANVSGKQQLVDLLSEKKTQWSSGWSPLHFAAKHGNMELTIFMIEHGANIEAKDKDGRAPIHTAAQEGHKSIVEYFLDKGVSANDVATENGWTPLHYAAWKGRLDVVKSLVDRGGDINAIETSEDGKKPIQAAAQAGHTEVVEYFISQGINIDDIAIRNEWTSLHFAVRNNHLELVDFLLGNGANINAKENYGWTVLHFAGYYHSISLELAAFLLDQGADINAETDYVWDYQGKYYKAGSTPLEVAEVKGRQEIADLFREKESEGGSGWTPLHFAAKRGNMSLAKFMLECGTNILRKDKDGKIAEDLAVEQNQSEIVAFFERLKQGGPGKRKRRDVFDEHSLFSDNSLHEILDTDLSKHFDDTARDTLNKVNHIMKGAATSGASKEASLINGFFGWIKDVSGKLCDAKAALSEAWGNGLNLLETSENSSRQSTKLFSNAACVTNNAALTLFLLQSFLDKKYPLPEFCYIVPEEVLARTLEITRSFEQALSKTAEQFNISLEDFDFFKVHLKIANHVRNERFSKIPDVLLSAAKEIFSGDEKFLNTFKEDIETMLGRQQIISTSNNEQNFVNFDSMPSFNSFVFELANDKSWNGIALAN